MLQLYNLKNTKLYLKIRYIILSYIIFLYTQVLLLPLYMKIENLCSVRILLLSFITKILYNYIY